MALFLAEFLCRALKHEADNGPLFSYVLYSLEWLDASERAFSNFHLVFITRLTRFLGFYPNVEAWHEGDFFRHGECLFRAVPSAPPRLSGAARGRAHSPFMRMNYDSMRFFAMNRLERERYLEVLNEYYRLHIPEFPALKSPEVLKEVFA